MEKWEVQHADIAFGGDYGPVLNNDLIVTGYMYNQMLEYDPSSTEIHLKARAINESKSYENFFLHFIEDTEFIVTDVTLSSRTSLRGVPWVFGYTVSPDHAGCSFSQSGSQSASQQLSVHLREHGGL